jgi:hypothetical protein
MDDPRVFGEGAKDHTRGRVWSPQEFRAALSLEEFSTNHDAWQYNTRLLVGLALVTTTAAFGKTIPSLSQVIKIKRK